MNEETPTRLTRWQRLAVAGFLFTFIPLGFMVVHRDAFLQRRMGDLGCYLRAAWAVRTGVDPYSIVEENKFHYNYPPFLAIVMTPLADAPAGEPRPLMLPYWGSVLAWYVINLFCLALGVHWLASALEEHLFKGANVSALLGSCRWWALRLLPLAMCSIPIGHSFMRGQVNPIVIMCLCACNAALIRGQSWRAGWWLSWPICIKVFPAFLLLYPLVQRNWRCLAGCAVGLFVGLVVIPMAYFGPQRTVDYYGEFVRVTLAPGLGVGEDQSRSEELTHLTSTDSQSFLALLHNNIYPDPYYRPENASPALRLASYLLGALVLLVTLVAGRWRRRPVGAEAALYLGALVMVMLFICPVCHLHYFSFATPMVMGVIAAIWGKRVNPSLGWGFIMLFAFNVIGNILPNFPSCEALRDRCFATIPALLLWATAIFFLWQQSRKQIGLMQVSPTSPNRLAA